MKRRNHGARRPAPVIALLFVVRLPALAWAQPGGCNAPDMLDVSTQTGVDCTGHSDTTAGVNTALSLATGKTLWVPAGCKLGLASPASDDTSCTASGTPLPCCTGSGTGTCHVSLVVPSATHILC